MKPKTAKKAASSAKKKPRLVFKPEVLDRVGISYPLLWQWMRDGKFPLSRVVGGKIAWLEKEIDDWIVTRPQSRYRPRPEVEA